MRKIKNTVDICEKDYDIYTTYHSQNRWVDSDTIVLWAKNKKTEKNYFMIVSLKNGTRKILNDNEGHYVADLASYTVSGRNIIYTERDKVFKLNIDSMEEEIIFKIDQDEKILKFLYDDNADFKYKSNLIMPHVTNDGKYVSFFLIYANYDTMEPSGYIPEKYSICYVVDIETKKLCYKFQKVFNGSAWVANHFAINPNDHNLVAFSHEGDCALVANRVWFYDNNTEKMYNAAKQKMTEDMDLGEQYTHDVWAPDGRGMYIVKFRDSIIKPCGIVYLDKESLEQEILYTGFDYLHVAASCDDKYLVADTVMDSYTMESEIILIDQEKKTEIPIDKVKVMPVHPCHAHPQMSPDNNKISYTMLRENGDIAVRIACMEEE